MPAAAALTSTHEGLMVWSGLLVNQPLAQTLAKPSLDTPTLITQALPAYRSANDSLPLAQISGEKYFPLSGLTHFFTRNEVDEPARPLFDWEIHTNALPNEALHTLTLTLWVTASGHIEHWEIRQQSPPGQWGEALLRELEHTEMQPATLDGRAVASRVSIEIGFDTRL